MKNELNCKITYKIIFTCPSNIEAIYKLGEVDGIKRILGEGLVNICRPMPHSYADIFDIQMEVKEIKCLQK